MISEGLRSFLLLVFRAHLSGPSPFKVLPDEGGQRRVDRDTPADTGQSSNARQQGLVPVFPDRGLGERGRVGRQLSLADRKERMNGRTTV